MLLKAENTLSKFRLTALLIQTGCGIGALVLGRWVQLQSWAIVGLALLTACVMLPGLVAPGRRSIAWRRGLILAWLCTAGLVGGLSLTTTRTWWEAYYACLAWLVSAAIAVAGWGTPHPSLRRSWQGLLALWTLAGVVLWIGAAWLQNQAPAFYIGLVFLMAWLLLVRIKMEMPMSFKLGLHAMMMLIVALPLVDRLIPPAPVYRVPTTDTVKTTFIPAIAKKDPSAFSQWWSHYQEQWNLMARDIFMRDPGGFLPFRLRPNSHGFLFRSPISINSLGLRGPEVPAVKGATYRIVTLGESTTFGCTLKPGDMPWPELLEKLIRDRIHPSRPVEVINAGVPAYDLQDNLHRMDDEILPLKPDMIISYHGYNGFKLLSGSLPRSKFRRPPPLYKPRPLRLLAQAEYRLKMGFYKARAVLTAPPLLENPSETDYARAYRQLIQVSRTNHIQLVLANFSMAVNHASSPEMVEYYKSGFPIVRWEIRANRVHSLIVKDLADAHPDVVFIDTHSNLDGVSDQYIDLVHFTQAGRQQLAETIFAGIENRLETDLSP